MPGRDTHHLPSPSLSPPGPRVMSRQHSHSSCSDDDNDPAARSALEIRREKNRIKQRNLRLRRANQMADLERTVQSMRANTHDLEDRLAVIEQREASLTAWVRDLENALMANGHREHVDSLRRMWGGSAVPPPESHAPQQSSTRDPLATLASAASSYRPSAHSQRWEEDESSSRKRRRHDDEYPSSMHANASTRDSHSPSRAMRIDQLCLPRSSTQSSSVPSESWGWNHVQSLDHQQPAYHQYETKPRVVPQGESSYDHKPRAASHTTQHPSHSTRSHPPPPSHDARRSISPADHRPMSSSSSGGTSRSWHSPVQSFDVRL